MKKLILIMVCLFIAAVLFAGGKQEDASDAGGMDDGELTGEVNLFSWWYPIMGPIRTAIFIGFVLFALQGIATLYRDIYFLVRHEEL